jgi:hypothetical protein
MRSIKVLGPAAFAIAVVASPVVAQPIPKDLAAKVAVLDAIRLIAEKTCPAVSTSSYSTTLEANAKLTATLPNLWKALVNLGGELGAKYEKSTSQGVVQVQLAGVLVSTNKCRVDIMNKAMAALFAVQPNLPADRRISPDQPLLMADGDKHAPLPAGKSDTQHPLLSAPKASDNKASTSYPQLAVLKVFLKNNLSQQDVVALAKLLPQFDVRMGSSQIEPRYPVDTIFVTRNDRHREDVLALAAALKQLGINIKSVQDSDLHSGRLLEVGTYLSNGGQTFRDSPALDFNKLAALSDERFWRAAYNGKIMCSGGPNHGHECSQAELAARGLQ